MGEERMLDNSKGTCLHQGQLTQATETAEAMNLQNRGVKVESGINFLTLLVRVSRMWHTHHCILRISVPFVCRNEDCLTISLPNKMQL